MNRNELAQWHREQAEILDSGKPLEVCVRGVWIPADGDSKFIEYRLAPERMPIPDYDLTESEVRELIDQGYRQIAQDKNEQIWAYRVLSGCESFYTDETEVDRACYTGQNWRESLRELKL